MSNTVIRSHPQRPSPGIVEKWTRDILAGELAEIREAFAERGAAGPELAWSPTAEVLPSAQLQFLLEYWRVRAGERRAPTIRDIDPIEMRPALGFIVLTDVIAGGADFRFRLYGSTVAAVSGFDLTGKRLSEHPAPDYVSAFYLALYRAAYRRVEPVSTTHRPPLAVHTHTWHRLMLPLADDSGEVVRFLSGNVPIRSNGEPVLLRL
ncbi:MAG: PAS domain-containing protein [Acidobacteriota bacterium]